MSAVAAPTSDVPAVAFHPSCGLSQEKVIRFHDKGICLILNARCQNPTYDGRACNLPIGCHYSELGVVATAPQLIGNERTI